jgi:hypothetical protein
MLEFPNSDFNSLHEDLAKRTTNVKLPKRSLFEIFRPGNYDYISVFQLKNPFVIIMYALDAAYGNLTQITHDELNKKDNEESDLYLNEINNLRKRFPHLDIWGKMKPYEVSSNLPLPWKCPIAVCGFCGEDYVKIQRDALRRAGYEAHRIIEGTLPFEQCLFPDE